MITSSTEIQLENDTFYVEHATKLMRSKKSPLVESYDLNKKCKVFKPIISTRTCSSKDFILIKTESNEAIILTPEHKVFTDAGWFRADTLSRKSQLMDATIGMTNIIDLHRIQNKLGQKVYTLTIEDTQCFFANNLLVHNDC